MNQKAEKSEMASGSPAETALPSEPVELTETAGLFDGVDAAPATPEELQAAEGEVAWFVVIGAAVLLTSCTGSCSPSASSRWNGDIW